MKRSVFLFIISMLTISLLTSGAAVTQKARPAAGSAAAPAAGWSVPVNISNNSAYSEGPYLAIDAKSNAYVSWIDWYGGVGGRRDMMFNTNKTGKWGTPRSNELAYTMIDDVGFPQVTVNPSGSSAIYAWMDGYFGGEPRMAIFADELSSSGWNGASLISAAVSLPSTYVTLATSPVDNTVCFIWQQDMDPGFALAYQYLNGTTGAMSYPELVTSTQGGGQYLPNICVDAKGTAHCAYTTRAIEAVIWYTSNANPKNLNGWKAPVALSSGTGLDWSYPMIAASNDGDAYAVWQEDHAGLEEIYFKYQKDGVWQATQQLTTTTNPSEFPSIAVNPVTEDVYVTWVTLTGSGHGDIWLKTYETNKATGKQEWSSPIQLTTSGLALKSCIRATKDPDILIVYEEDGEIWFTAKLAPRLTVIALPTVTAKVNRVLFSSEKTLTVNFAKNPENDDATLKEYRLYYKKAEESDSAYTYVTFAPTATLQYVMTKLPVAQKYSFKASVVNKDGLELVTAAVVSN
jgi:hypothetical protein